MFQTFYFSFGFNWKQTIFINICPLIVLWSAFIVSSTISVFNMFLFTLINYCAAYFTYIQTKIRMLNVFMQDDAHVEDDEKVLFLIKQIVKDHKTAIE